MPLVLLLCSAPYLLCVELAAADASWFLRLELPSAGGPIPGMLGEVGAMGG